MSVKLNIYLILFIENELLGGERKYIPTKRVFDFNLKNFFQVLQLGACFDGYFIGSVALITFEV